MKKFRYTYIPLILSLLYGAVTTACSSDEDDLLVEAPAVSFVAPENGYSVEINETLVPEIKISGSDPLSFSWLVDGKENANTRDFAFRRNAEGVYNLSVTARNSKGTASDATQVLVVKPGTDIAVAIDRTVGAELPRYVTTMIGANIHSLHNVDYLWTIACEDSTWTSTDKQLEFSTPFTGAHTVSLTITNILGSATDQVDINVKHAPLDVAIEQEGEEPLVECGKILKLNAVVSGDSVSSYQWFVDGKVESDSTVLNFSKVDPGNYDVRLVAANRDGVEYEAQKTVKVYSAGFNFGLRFANIETEIGEGETMKQYAVCEWENASYEWTVDGEVVSTDKEYTFPGSTEIGKVFKLGLTIKRGDESYPFEKTIKITEKYASGAFFLFEGNMTSENGAISFISDGGTVYNRLYRENNDGAQLGNVSQGLFLRDRKVYVVAQNGQNTAYGVPNGGDILTVMDGRTMKKLDSFGSDIFGNLIKWPREVYVPNTRYAVLKSTNMQSENNSTTGVLDMQTRTYYQMEFPKDGSVERISCYICRKGVVYGSYKNSIYKIDVENHKVGEKVLTLDFDIAELLPSRDGSIWAISDLSVNIKQVAKLTSDFKLIEQKTTPSIVQSSGSGMSYRSVSVGSDYIFFATSSSGGSAPVYKYNFDTNIAIPMGSQSFYNAFAYNETKGTLYIGQMDEYDFSGDMLQQITHYTISGASWPAGIWFTYNFDEW